MIHTDDKALRIPLDPNKPFRLVLFHLTFKQSLKDELDTEQERAAYFIREYIHATLSREFPESLTLQIEKDQVMAILFAEETGEKAEESAAAGSPERKGQDSGSPVNGILERMKQVFDLDKAWCLVTIAVSPLNRQSVDFAGAYGEVSDLLSLRRLADESQIIAGHSGEWKDDKRFRLSAAEEKELAANLASGNDTVTVPIVQRSLQLMNGKNASARHAYAFAEEITDHVLKTLQAFRIEAAPLLHPLDPYDRLRECFTYEELGRYLEHMLREAAALVRSKKEESDPVTSYVTDYLERHYAEDISLDMLAEKLNITGSYLSTYFKEKTGVNFSDFLNEVRMNKAKEMLRQTDLRIQDVALRVGYQNVNSFIRLFKKSTGVPPGEYRKEMNLS
ncbi:helix-turn-helix domain-containing protein [Paenibacillus sp. MBLB4367]|uniref:helix-turn-helix domain-containing protein n=1 Tax=Paenibacillus sp. MBLB4367 TaxID=3384767 RepID=UPI00390825DB